MAIDAHAVVVPAAMDGSDDDPEARVAALFDAHYKRLFRLARRLVRDPDDPADVVQETFLRAARAPPTRHLRDADAPPMRPICVGT